jgi:hypothetical protein
MKTIILIAVLLLAGTAANAGTLLVKYPNFNWFAHSCDLISFNYQEPGVIFKNGFEEDELNSAAGTSTNFEINCYAPPPIEVIDPASDNFAFINGRVLVCPVVLFQYGFSFSLILDCSYDDIIPPYIKP